MVKKQKDDNDQRESRKIGMVKKGTLANAQAKLNRRSTKGNYMVESGILRQRNGDEMVERNTGRIDDFCNCSSQLGFLVWSSLVMYSQLLEIGQYPHLISVNVFFQIT